MTIKYYKYKNASDYGIKSKVAKKPKKPKNLIINKFTLIKASITVGVTLKEYKDFQKEVLEWKVSNILTFIDSNNLFTIKHVSSLEQSEKNVVGYFIGMVFAQIHMQQKYNIRYLLHLKRDDIEVINAPGKSNSPDFWGLNHKSGESYLVEAKGSTVCNSKLATKPIKDALCQLKSVNQINYTYQGIVTSYSKMNSNLKKLIVATHPDRDKKIIQHIIDPEESASTTFNVNGDKIIFDYYNCLFDLIYNESFFVKKIKKIKFNVVYLAAFDCLVGLEDNIYEVILRYKDEVFRVLAEEDIYEIFTAEINNTLDNLEGRIIDIQNSNKFSVGIDGVIVLENDQNEIQEIRNINQKSI
ncbi:hypothetical protein ACE3MZ_13075 [Paenibacillus sp. WLX1005]|uniref:hypothetical protein n=1 Tax=Paenibacillus sp. WLX1005 TaxID=3243766 RepID=UPI0039841D48